MQKENAMKTQVHYHRFCGIDIGKAKHVACVLDAHGNYVVRRLTFGNDAAGYQQILACLQQAGGPGRVLAGMEATGHYWYSLHDFLTRAGYRVDVINPIHTAQQARRGVRKSKTDKLDAHRIAIVLKNGDYHPVLIPGELAMTCRQLTRLRTRLVSQGARIKQIIWSRLQPAWPEYENLFSKPLGPTGRKLLAAAPTPEDLLALDPESLTEMIRLSSRGQFGPAKAQEILQAARESVGMRRGLKGARIGIRILLRTLEVLRPIQEQLEAEIEVLADQVPPYVQTLPGAGPLTAASLYGETDPIESFGSADQLVAFSGLDPTVFQTGQYLAPRSHISKRGSPFLRCTLWAMAGRAVRCGGPLRDLFLRRRRRGVHYYVALTAAAAKLCRISWRILIERRAYDPSGPPPRPATAS